MGTLHDPVTWYKITYTGVQVAQWDFQNKGRCIVLEVPLCNLLASICNFVPYDRVVQRAYCFQTSKLVTDPPYLVFTGSNSGSPSARTHKYPCIHIGRSSFICHLQCALCISPNSKLVITQCG